MVKDINGKWFISKKGNRCRYIYRNNKKIAIQWRSTKKTMIQGKMQKNKGYIILKHVPSTAQINDFIKAKDNYKKNIKKKRKKKYCYDCNRYLSDREYPYHNADHTIVYL